MEIKVRIHTFLWLCLAHNWFLHFRVNVMDNGSLHHHGKSLTTDYKTMTAFRNDGRRPHMGNGKHPVRLSPPGYPAWIPLRRVAAPNHRHTSNDADTARTRPDPWSFSPARLDWDRTWLGLTHATTSVEFNIEAARHTPKTMLRPVPKDKTCGFIYRVNCSECSDFYISKPPTNWAPGYLSRGIRSWTATSTLLCVGAIIHSHIALATPTSVF